MPKVLMIKTTKGSSDGFSVKTYEKDIEYVLPKDLAFAFVEEMKVAKYVDGKPKRKIDKKNLSPAKLKELQEQEIEFKKEKDNFKKEKDSYEQGYKDVLKKQTETIDAGKIAMKKLLSFASIRKEYTKLHEEFLKKPDKKTKDLLQDKLLELGTQVEQIVAGTAFYKEQLEKTIDSLKSNNSKINNMTSILDKVNKILLKIEKIES